MGENSENRHLFFGNAASVEFLHRGWRVSPTYRQTTAGFSLVLHTGRSRTGAVLGQIAQTPVFQRQLAYTGGAQGFELEFSMFLSSRRFVSSATEFCKAVVGNRPERHLWYKHPGLLKTSAAVACGGSDTTGPRCPVLCRPQHLNSTGNYARYIEDSNVYNINLALRARVNPKVRS